MLGNHLAPIILRRRHFLLIGMLCMCMLHSANSSLYGQEISVSENLDLSIDEDQLHLCSLHDQTYLLRTATNIQEVYALNKDMQVKQKLEWVYEKNKLETIELMEYEGLIYHFYYYRDKGLHVLKLRTYDPKLIELSNDTLGVFESQGSTFQITSTLSKDKSKCVFSRLARTKDTEFLCFDLREMEVIWRKNFELDNADASGGLNVILTNNAKVYLIAHSYASFFGPMTYKLNVWSSEPLQTDFSSFVIESKGIQVMQNVFAYDELRDQIINAGFYSERKNGRAHGFFTLRLNGNNMEQANINVEQFSRTLEANITSEARDRQLGIMDIYLKDVLITENGNVLLVSEIERVLNRSIASLRNNSLAGRSNYISEEIFNQDIVLLMLNQEGELIWDRVLHKKQFSQDDNGAYSSYFMLRNSKALHFYFNDEINLGNTVSQYIVKLKGESVRNSLYNTSYQKLRLMFRYAIQLDGKSFIIPSRFANNFNLVKVSY